MSPPSRAPAPAPPTSWRTTAARWRASRSSTRWTARRGTRRCYRERNSIEGRLGNPAGQRGGLLHPHHHELLVELVVFVDVEVAHVLVLGLAGRKRTQ